MYRGENLQIGTYDGKPLMSELSGNVIDVCPVGALTNKVYRFRARPWEMVARASLGYHDALGSNLFLHVRNGEVMRAVPRDNETINECWLSDRDRYAHQGLQAADRARVPMLRDGDAWREAGWDEALARAAEILGENRGDALGVLAHPATSNEEGELLVRLADGLGTGHLDHRIHALDLSDAAVAEPFAASVADIERADAIIVVGSDLREEVPLLAARLRKAAKHGVPVHAVNPVDVDFAMPLASRRLVAPSALAATLDGRDVREALAGRAQAVLLLGALAENGAHAAAIRAAARRLAADTGARICRIPSGANAVGLARAGLLPTGLDARAMLAAPRRAYLLHGIEPGLDFADPALAARALGGGRVVALSAFACASTRALAEVILPIALLPEMDARLTNLDGHVQGTQAAAALPGDARPGWRVLRALGAQLAVPGFDFTDLDGLRAGMQARAVAAVASMPPVPGEGSFELFVKPGIYRVDAVLRRSPALQSHPLNLAPAIALHPDAAARLGLAEGAILRVRGQTGTAHLPLRLHAGLPVDVAMVEGGHPATAPLTAGRISVEAA
jgi:NADH-quinone oxidoreductase subunit G